MAQQINLHTPVLMQRRRPFSAAAMAVSLGVFAVGIAALSFALVQANGAIRSELDAARRAAEADRTRLAAALADHPAPSPDALRQELKDRRDELARVRERLAALRTGLLDDGRGNAAMLRLLAQTVPSQAWLTEVRLDAGRFEVSGETLDPAVLQPWIERLGADTQLAGRPLATLRVEQRKAEAGTAERWRFALVNGPVGAAP